MAGIDSTLVSAILASWGLDDPDLAGQFVILAEVQRYNVSTEAVEVFYAATGEYGTGTADSPANQPYKVCLNVPAYTQSILNADWQGSAGKLTTQVQFDNVDGRIDADFARATYSWRGRQIAFYGGLTSWARSAFKPVFGDSRIMDVLRSPTDVACPLTPLPDRPDKPMQPNFYGGFGAAYDFSGTAVTELGDVYNLGMRNASISVAFKHSGSGSNEVLLDKRGSLAASGVAGWVVYKSTSDQLRIRIDDGSNTVLGSIGDAGEFTDGVRHTLTVTISRSADEMIGYVDGAEELAAADISAVTGHLSNTSSFAHGALTGGTSNWDGELDEPRVWHKVLTARQASNNEKFACDGVELGLVGCWPYDEYDGTDIFNLIEGPGLVQAGFNGLRNCSMGTTAADPSTVSCTLTGWFRAASGASGVIAGRRTAAAAANVGLNVRLASGDVIFECSDGSSGLRAVTIAGDYDDSTLYGFALVIDRALDELRGYVLDFPRGTLTAGTPVDITDDTTYGGGSVNFKLGAYDDGTGGFSGYQSWIFWTPAVLNRANIKIALSEQAADLDDEAPTSPPIFASVDAGTHFWPLNENTGTTATDQIGAINGTFSSTPTWIDRDGDLTTGAGSAFTSTLEGNAALKGTLKPVALGRPQRLLPVLVDYFFLIYQYSDPALGVTQSVELVQSGALDLVGGGTDYTADKTNNIITMAALQDQPVTMNVKGVTSGGAWLRFPGECISWAWQNMAGIAVGSINTTSVSAYDTSHPYECAYYFGSSPVALDAFNEYMVSPDGFAFRELGGKFALGSRVSPAAQTATLDLSVFDSAFGSGAVVSMFEEPCPPVTWLARIGFNRTWYLHDSFLGAAGEADKRLHQQEFRFVSERQDELRTSYKDSVIRTYLTPYHKRQDAALLVQRMLTLDGVERYAWRADLGAYHYGADIGDVAKLGAYSRYDVASTNFQVVGYTYGQEQGASRSELVLWG